jgi:uncharacterized protein (TIGR02145 family)
MKTYSEYKHFYIFVLFACFISLVEAQDKPYAMIKMAKDVYIDETEVDVSSWLSYYSWILIHEGWEEAQKILPDSTAIEPELWTYIRNKSTDYIDKQASHTLQPIGYFANECRECAKFGKRLRRERGYCAMLEFPVTGLTFEQVTKFCEWRTRMEGNNKLVFRLPTPDEWKNFALNGLTETEQKKGFRDSLNNKKCAHYNFQISCSCGNDDYQGKLNAVGMFDSERNGAFDVFGNVSEMTSLKGIAKGGNFKIHANQCHPDSVQNYTKPEIWLGFRCIAVKSINNNVNNRHQTNTPKENNPKASINEKFDKITDPRDGKTYPTVRIGDQTWLAANLAYKPDSGKYWAYNNEEKYVVQYGYLYTWETAKDVCPSGWHLPNKEEYETLLQTVGGKDTQDAYIALIPIGNSGFSVLSVGSRLGAGNYTPNEKGSAFWSSSENTKRMAWTLDVGDTGVTAGVRGNFRKGIGLPVRCIKN